MEDIAGRFSGTRANDRARSSIRCQEIWTAMAAAIIMMARGEFEDRSSPCTAAASSANAHISAVRIPASNPSVETRG